MNWPEVYLHMKAGASLDESHRKQVEAVLEKYPFFALGRMMVAKLATHTGDPQAQQLRFLASLYAPSRQYYAFFLEERLRPRVPPPPKTAVASAREGHSPAPSSSPKEEPPAGDEPGPADMAFSSAFWPPLQGWLAARQVLYAPLRARLLQQLHLPALIHSAEAPPSATSAASPAEPPAAPAPSETLAPLPPAEPSSASPSETQVFPEARSAPPPPPPIASTDESPTTTEQKAEILASIPHFSDTLDLPPPTPLRPPPAQLTFLGKLPIPLIQFELLPGPRPKVTEKIATSEERPQPFTAESEVSYAFSEAPSPPFPSAPEPPPHPPTEPSPATPELPIEPLSALSRAYIPLENPEGFIHPPEAESLQTKDATPSLPEAHYPTQQAKSPETETETSALSAESTLHRSFIPLENPDSPIHLPTEGSPTSAPPSWVYVSESPIRPLIPFEIDIEASIHLPVPEATEEAPSPPEGSPTPAVPSAEPASLVAEPSPSQRESPQKPWQSFLREIELQLPVSELKVSPTSKELENLRRAFIRQLLEQRPTEPLRPPSPEAPNLIDKLIEKLQTLPKNPPVEGPPELSAPAREAPPPHPRIYTETMAKLYWSQGDLPRAIEVYEALCKKHPDKAAYFQSQIERIRSGEAP